MTENELAQILKTMYDNAEEGNKVAMIHLFGIKYAEEIKKTKITSSKIIQLVGMQKSYATEISKGIKLSQFVTVK